MAETSSSEGSSVLPPQTDRVKLQLSFLPRTPQATAVTFCALAIVALFFAPWLKHPATSGFGYCERDALARTLWIIPVLALATIFRQNSPVARKWLGTLTAIAALAGVGYVGVSTRALGYNSFNLEWGASLTALFGFGLFAFSGERRLSAPVDLVARKLNSRKADVYSHTCTLTPGIHFSAQEFYDTLTSVIRDKQWPGVELLRIRYTEAGLLSHKREYLRIIRQRHLFDICAATFGKDYFFSIRESEIPAVVDARAFLVLIIAFAVILFASIKIFGTIFGSVAFGFVLVVLVWFLFNVLKLGLTKVDSIFIQLPVIGPVYEAWFRKSTFFEEDTRIVFLQSVTELVKQSIEQTTSAKGIRFLSSLERQPILDQLYKRSRIPIEQPAASPA